MEKATRDLIRNRAGRIINGHPSDTLSEAVAMAEAVIYYCPADMEASMVLIRLEEGEDLQDEADELWEAMHASLESLAPPGMLFGREDGRSRGHLGFWPDPDATLESMGFSVPEWVQSSVTPDTVSAIYQGGCHSGAYMPAVTYSVAVQTMAEHGDAVLAYLEDITDYDAPTILSECTRAGDSWAGIACSVLSYAVELWAGSVFADLDDAGYWP